MQNHTKVVTNVLAVGHRKITEGEGETGGLSPSLQSLPHLWLRLPAHFVKAFSGASLNLTELAPELSIHFSTCSVVDNWMSS